MINDDNMNYDELSNEVGEMLMHSNYTRSCNILLASELNKTKASFINQIHYWTTLLRDEKHYHEGRYWVYESYPSWQKQFPDMTVRAIQKTLLALEEDGYIIVGNFNDKPYDRTKWYAVNYEKVKSVLNSYGQYPEKEEDPDELSSSPPSEQSSSGPHEQSSSPIPNISIPNNSIPNKINEKINGAFSEKNALYRLDNNHIQSVPHYMARTRERLDGWEETKNHTDYLCELLEYYFYRYEQFRGEAHPPLRPEYMRRVCRQLLSYGFKPEDFFDMMDNYLRNNTMDTDYNILHFTEDGIIINRAYEEGYGYSQV